MMRSFGTPLALFGLLLALAMVCTTSAQGWKSEELRDQPASSYSLSRPASANVQSGRAMPLIVGRYQAVSHDGKLTLLDTATGECFRRNASAWERLVAPIEENAASAAR
jgi:hypothetical protein